MEFGLQVRSLASLTLVMLLHLTRLRMLSRWMRTTWGPSTPFAILYHNVFNHAYSIHALGLDFTSVVRSSSLDEYHSDDVSDATVLLNHESECILALAEILLALCGLLQRARTALADRVSHDVIMEAADSEDSAVASTLADWVSNIDIMVALDQAFTLTITPSCQVMFDSSTMSLTHGSLEDLWTDTVTSTTG
ncbi:hypothetical protein DYB26_004040 [Aphanomyces astaci]|uniref:Uncharacterized protein n=1 Tax=Aphanomyces astaci TaxID=112090 RepID=A0A418F1E4_APHAT|nr:hypothetical protein DYB26_004040 [Aphanomyces astaci]